MTDKLKQTIKEELVKLPKENQSAISTFGWEKISQEIGEKYLLNGDELSDFQLEVFLVLIGLEEPNLFVDNLQDNVDMNKDIAEKISTEIMQKIFIPINNILIESVKRNIKDKNTDWRENIGFIMSGGNFSNFIATKKIIIKVEPEKKKTPAPLTPPPTLSDIKANAEKTKIPIRSISDKVILPTALKKDTTETPIPIKPKETTSTKPTQ